MALAHSKEDHNAIARELIGHAASVLNRAANRLKVAVQEENDIVRQCWLGQPSETVQVNEQHDNLLLLPGDVLSLVIGGAMSRV